MAASSSSNAQTAMTDAAETSHQSQELLHEMRRLRMQMSELERVAGVRMTRRATRSRPDRLATSVASSTAGESSLVVDGGLSGAETPRDLPPSPARSQRSQQLNLQLKSMEDKWSGTSILNGSALHATPPIKSPLKSTPRASALSLSQTWSWPQASPNHLNDGTPILASRSGPSAAQLSRTEQGPVEFSGWEYRPHPSSDPVDAAVAVLVNRPGRYRGWRALLCRLEQGVYLCGTRRVHLRADVSQDRIEASDDGGLTWADLEELMKGAEASQRARLERARDGWGIASGLDL